MSQQVKEEKQIVCPDCGNNQFWVSEECSYDASFADGKLIIDINDYATDGFQNLTCQHCHMDMDIRKYKLGY